METIICVPSYRRPNKIDTLKYLPHIKIYIDEGEAEEYKKNYPEAWFRVMSKGVQGNICRVRNYILDDKENEGKAICIVDDDLKHIGYFEEGAEHRLSNESEVLAFINKYNELAESWDIKFWGINVNPDKQCYREYTPFSLTSYVASPFGVHLGHCVRYDEKLSLKEDYDFTLQFLNHYRKILRVNKYFYNVKQMEQEGGCATYRNVEEEKRQLDLLQKKWGKRIVHYDTLTSSRSHKSTKIKRFDVNPVIIVPIKGI